MTQISEKIKQKICEEKICPRAKWFFVVKQIFLWIGAVITFVAVSIALSLSWEIISEQELWVLRSRLGLMTKAVPYFWLVISLILSGFVYFEFKKTKRAYKVNFWVVLVVILLGTLFLSSILYFVGLAEIIEERLEEDVKGYHKVVPLPHHHWMQPESGLLMGEIMEIYEKKIELEDMEDNYWIVILEEDTRIGRKGNLEKGLRIKVLGEEKEDYNFKAEFIMPGKGGLGKMK